MRDVLTIQDDEIDQLSPEEVIGAALDYSALIISSMPPGSMHENLSMKKWILLHSHAVRACAR